MVYTTKKPLLSGFFSANSFGYSLLLARDTASRQRGITGHSFTDEIEGEEIKEYHIADVFLVDNKVRRIIVTKKQI